MEINVTSFVIDADHCSISASQAELGANAAKVTWGSAQDAASAAAFLNTDDECDKARDWLAEFGAWSGDELCAMSNREVRALIIQFVSGDVREAEKLAPGDGPGFIDWAALRVLQEEGAVSSHLFLSDDGLVYFDLN